MLTLTDGSYRFRAYKNGQQYWSGAANHRTIPGCSTSVISMAPPTQTTMVNYTYDLLSRLTGATHTGNYTGAFAYTLNAG